MTALNRKLLRDLWRTRGQAFAIAAVVACGVATFVMSLSTLSSLHRTRSAYYERYRFAEVFAHLKRAPASLAERIAEIPGVAQVQTRVVAPATLDVPFFAEPIAGRLISIPDQVPLALNLHYLREGRSLEPRAGEILVSDGFARAHGLKPGDALRAVLNGRFQQFRIAGVALSPEYVYQIREGELLPDDRRFGVLWVGEADLAAAFDMEGAFNDVALTLEPDAIEQDVIARLDQLLDPYGGLGAYGRDDQPSHRFVSNELKELRGMALVVPTIFLIVAAFLLHVSMSRLVAVQREQIAALRSFGYTRLEVGSHYLKYTAAIVAAGAVVGILVGGRLGYGVTELYTKFFHFPLLLFRLDPLVVASAIFLSAIASFAGASVAVAAAARLPPAEAMRPVAPARFRATILERLGFQRFAPPLVRMLLRNVARQPVRSTLTLVGMTLAVAVLILGNFAVDAVDEAMDAQFSFAQRQDLTVSMTDPANYRLLSDAVHLPGVHSAEPFRSVPVRLRFGHRSRRLGLMGLQQDARLFRVVDVNRRELVAPQFGLVLSQKLAEVLAVEVGDSVVVEVLEGRRPVRDVQVVGLIDDFSGIAAYAALHTVNSLMDEGKVVSGAFLAADAALMDALYAELKQAPRVAGVSVKGTALATFRKTIAENLLRMRLYNVLFASAIAVGVVYNAARIALSERSRELATLRVIGFTRGEISIVLLGELALLTVMAIPLGFAVGTGLARVVVELAYDTELFRIPLVVSRSTYGFAAAVVLAAAAGSALTVRRLLDKLDLIAVLKSKE